MKYTLQNLLMFPVSYRDLAYHLTHLVAFGYGGSFFYRWDPVAERLDNIGMGPRFDSLKDITDLARRCAVPLMNSWPAILRS